VKRVLALLLFAAALPSLAQVAPCSAIIQGFSATEVTTALCSGTTPPAVGDTVLVTVGNSQFETKVKEAPSILGVTNIRATVVDATKAQDNLLLLSGAQAATLKYGTTEVSAKVQPLDPLAAKNYVKYEWAVGPAKAPNTDPSNPTSSADNLDSIRFQGEGQYARGGIFGMKTDKASLLQSIFSISIDSTDTDSPAFCDNNRAAASVGFANLSAGRIWMHGNAGIEARADKAFHSDVSNIDAVMKVSGWVPVLRSFTLFSTQGQFIAAPLSFDASWGYRNRRQVGSKSSGRVFEGTANYYLFLFDDYQVQFTGTWTVNDMNSRDVPRTQRLFKATIAYLLNNKNGFEAVASFQDGAAGSMLDDVRQYFVGVALARLNLGGKGGSQ
jgi:hypothetical protein